MSKHWHVEDKDMFIIIAFKVMSIDEITKCWNPGDSKQEVSKMERIKQIKPIKGVGKASREFERKRAECVIPNVK